MVSFKVDEVTALEDTKIIKTLLKELEITDFLCSLLSMYFFVCGSEFHAGDGNSKPFLGQLFYVENCLRRRGRRWGGGGGGGSCCYFARDYFKVTEDPI